MVRHMRHSPGSDKHERLCITPARCADARPFGSLPSVPRLGPHVARSVVEQLALAHGRALFLTQAMAAWCRANEPSRPVQYESGGGAACTDIICPMYPTLASIGPLATSVRAQCAPSSAFEVAPTRIWPRHKHTQELRYAPRRAERVYSPPPAAHVGRTRHLASEARRATAAHACLPADPRRPYACPSAPQPVDPL